VIHHRRRLEHMPSELLPHAFMLIAGDVDLQHLHKRELLPQLLVNALQTAYREVDQRFQLAAVQAQTVDDHLQHAHVDHVDGDGLRALAQPWCVKAFVHSLWRLHNLHAEKV
jgi:hypothetical protein